MFIDGKFRAIPVERRGEPSVQSHPIAVVVFLALKRLFNVRAAYTGARSVCFADMQRTGFVLSAR
jgi:hypothetical protein